MFDVWGVWECLGRDLLTCIFTRTHAAAKEAQDKHQQQQQLALQRRQLQQQHQHQQQMRRLQREIDRLNALQAEAGRRQVIR